MKLFLGKYITYQIHHIICHVPSITKNNSSVACDPSCLNFVLFDVRPPDQFNQCHLQSTMHLETTDDGKKLVEQITNHIEGMNLIF